MFIKNPLYEFQFAISHTESIIFFSPDSHLLISFNTYNYISFIFFVRWSQC